MLTRLRRRLSSEGGVSLVETLVAVLLVGFVLMAMASTTTASLASMRGAERHTRGTHFANQLIEDLHSLQWEDLTLYASDCPAPPDRPACTAEHSAGSFEGAPLVIEPTRPAGSAAPLPTETITTGAQEGSVEYTVTRYITWIDDDLDGTEAAGTDPDGEDYKRMIVLLAWTAGGENRSQRFDANRAPPFDGPTPTDPFVITSYEVIPDPIVLNATNQYYAGSVEVPVGVSRLAGNVTAEFQPHDDGVWQPITMSSTDGGLNWTGTIPSSQVWTPGYRLFRYTATSPTGEVAPPKDEQVWVSQSDEKFVTVVELAGTPATRIGKKNNDRSNCTVDMTWGVRKSDPAESVSVWFTWSTDGGSSGWNWAYYVSTDPDGTLRYRGGVASNTPMSGTSFTFRAHAEGASGDRDSMSRTLPMVGGNSSCL